MHRILKLVYQTATGRITLEKPVETFPVRKGVRQGDPVSPKMFSAVLEDIFRRCDFPDTAGIRVDGEHMSALRFADDLVLISSDAIELQEMITQLNTESRKFGLKINIDKTKVMTNNVETPINIDEEELEYVTEYTYLGQIISFHDRQEK